MPATACGDDLEHGKPDPRLVGVALRKLGLAGSQTVMIGDTPYDAEAALEAGTKAAGVLTGGTGTDTLDLGGAITLDGVAQPPQAYIPLTREAGIHQVNVTLGTQKKD